MYVYLHITKVCIIETVVIKLLKSTNCKFKCNIYIQYYKQLYVIVIHLREI